LAGVNHRKVKQLIHQKVKTIKDREFFSSRVLGAHFADMAAVQTKRYDYNRKVKVKCVWEPKNPNLACTEGEHIWINAGHKLVTAQKARPTRYEIVCGLFAHELGHILYTNFLISQTYAQAVQGARWFPATPTLNNMVEKENATEIMAYCQADEKQAALMAKLLHEISNILEDGYVENKMLVRFPGVLGVCLDAMRKVQFADMPTVTEMIEREDNGDSHIWLTVLQLILSYVKFGKLKYGQEPLSDERIQAVYTMLGELEQAIMNPSSKARISIVNTVAVRCWPYIQDFLVHCEKKGQASAADGTQTRTGDLLSQHISALVGISQPGKGNTVPVNDSDDVKGISLAMGSKRSQTASKASALTPNRSEDNSATATVPSLNAAVMEVAGSSDEVPFQPVSAEENGRLPYTPTDSIYAPAGEGAVEQDDAYTGSGYTHAASDVEHLLESMAEKAILKDLESKRITELNELAQGISYGNAHTGINMKVHRMADVNEVLIDQYYASAGDLLRISKKLQRSVLQNLQDKRNGGKMTNLLVGRRLDPHTLPRNDGHVFYKSILPNEAPELAIGLLLDESGSMQGKHRATYARGTAIILYDFCRALNIPVMIYGHSTGAGKGVDMYSYAEFDAIDRNDCFRLMDISARGSNRDGAPLRYVAEQLTKRSEETKILMLVSDGQPSHTGYYGTAAEDDLRSIMQEYQRKGVLFVAAAIGSDKANIECIYGDAFLDITDLNKLPVMLTDVIKRHLRV